MYMYNIYIYIYIHFSSFVFEEHSCSRPLNSYLPSFQVSWQSLIERRSQYMSIGWWMPEPIMVLYTILAQGPFSLVNRLGTTGVCIVYVATMFSNIYIYIYIPLVPVGWSSNRESCKYKTLHLNYATICISLSRQAAIPPPHNYIAIYHFYCKVPPNTLFEKS